MRVGYEREWDSERELELASKWQEIVFQSAGLRRGREGRSEGREQK